MMVKSVVCPVCEGYGFTVTTSECSIQSRTCDQCKGSGALEVPMTNADRIRAMSDEELAWVLMEYRFDALSKANGSEPALPNTQANILKWLQQPAEDE